MPVGDITLAQVIDTVLKLGVGGLLLLIIITGAKEKPWWVFGNAHRREVARLEDDVARERAEKVEWKSMALRNLHIAEEGLDMAEAQGRRRATDRGRA